MGEDVIAWIFIAASVVGVAFLLQSLRKVFNEISRQCEEHNSAGPDSQ